MGDEQAAFEQLIGQFAGDPLVEEGKWFGKQCINTSGKAFTVLFDGDAAFKLTGDAHSAALQIEGARLFDPRGNGRAFKEWVHVPSAQSSRWSGLANNAQEYVSSLIKK